MKTISNIILLLILLYVVMVLMTGQFYGWSDGFNWVFFCSILMIVIGCFMHGTLNDDSNNPYK